MQKTKLRTSPLGGTGMEITRVGFGAWAIGGWDRSRMTRRSTGPRNSGSTGSAPPPMGSADLELTQQDITEIEAAD
jgi:hypothetical protein